MIKTWGIYRYVCLCLRTYEQSIISLLCAITPSTKNGFLEEIWKKKLGQLIHDGSVIFFSIDGILTKTSQYSSFSNFEHYLQWFFWNRTLIFKWFQLFDKLNHLHFKSVAVFLLKAMYFNSLILKNKRF